MQFDQAQTNATNYGKTPNSAIATQQQALQSQMEDADSNQNPDVRLTIYNQLEQKLVNDVAWIPMEQISLPTLTKPYVHGLVINSTEIIPSND